MIPEPFSITTGVLGIIGFLNLARAGAQALYKDVQAYQDAPKDVLKFSKDANLVEYRIDLWKRAWLIRPDSHQDWPVELWGERGWESICHLIDTLESLSRSIDDMFEPYLQEFVADQPMASTSGGNHASAPSIAADALRRRAMDKGNKDRLAARIFWLQKISYALANRENLKTHFDQYKGLIDSLRSMSKEAYFECHNVARCITNRERREMTIKSMLVAQALKTRDASWALHHSCKSAGKGVVELELSLLRWKLNENTGRPFHSGIPERLCYYVTLTPDAPDSPAEPPGGAPERKLELLFERRNTRQQELSFRRCRYGTGLKQLTYRRMQFPTAGDLLAVGNGKCPHHSVSSTSGGAEPRYRVLVGPCLGDNDGLFNLQTQRLGQLLRELALGSDFTSSYDNERDFILLVREVGEQYQKAIDFCCKRPPPGSALSLRTRKEYDNYYTGILADFFEHVVLP
ncbi:hypothetical protein H2204_014871 [Knufia peltigerae]|uniref:Uncharacterized protein n=1 Tax=Knufia peltigerae TaxID=1002370 RepID=A0AA39CM38_9EURO|nr:hypothetical protein H2204_014871 [Knufia peltigerae]